MHWLCRIVCGLISAIAILGVSVGSASVPVSVMLPLDTVTNDGRLKDPETLKNWFAKLRYAFCMVCGQWTVDSGRGFERECAAEAKDESTAS